MKKIIFSTISLLLLLGCSSKNDKDIYIKNKLPMIYKNLNESEIDLFKKSMEFKDNFLFTYDMDLLKKGVKSDFDSVIVNISREMGGNINNIVIIDSLGRESKIDSERFILKSLDNDDYILNDFSGDDTYLLIISTTCGSCVSFFNKANELAIDKDKKYVALFVTSVEVIDNYKNGIVINNFGFLDDNWIKFSNETNIIKKLKLDYSAKIDGYPTLFYKKNNQYYKTSNLNEIEEVLTNK